MRKNNRILKIVDVKFPKISFISNNGEFRIIDIKNLFKSLNYKKGDFGYNILQDKGLFNSVEIIDRALAWKNVTQVFKFEKGDDINLFFHLDPIVTINYSLLDDVYTKEINYGDSIRSIRKNLLHLSQEELGERIGSDKQYISKVENYKTDPELKTLRKIYEVGLKKKMFIAHYDKTDVIRSFSNSLLSYKFLKWAESNKNELNLIEGLGSSTIKQLKDNNIESTASLSELKVQELFEMFSSKISILHQPSTWPIQAKLIISSDWLTLIKLQRSISKKQNSSYSKIEEVAKKAIGKNLYQVK